MWTEAILLRIFSRSRALCALIALLFLLPLAGCGRGDAPAAETPAPEPVAREGLTGRWAASFDASAELLRRLGFNPGLSGPLSASLTLTVDGEGRCVLATDYGPCAAPLRDALYDYLCAIRAEESGRALSGVALAEALGADPNEFAGSLVDETLPPPQQRGGRLSEARDAVVWDGGEVSALRMADGGLRVSLADRGEVLFVPAD